MLGLISIPATFLSNRTMTVRVNNTWSVPLPVYGGIPQGSILGVLLFNVSTDDLEDDDQDARRLVYSTDSSDEASVNSLVETRLDSSEPWPSSALLGASSSASSTQTTPSTLGSAAPTLGVTDEVLLVGDAPRIFRFYVRSSTQKLSLSCPVSDMRRRLRP